MDKTGVAFRDLLAADTGLPVAERQRLAAAQLPVVVARSHLRWWAAGDPIPATGRRLLIGVSAWSGYDLRMLDFADAAFAADPFPDLVVDVFDQGVVRPPALFEPYIPGLGDVYQTPVVGLWTDGELVQRGAGYAGRKIVADLLGLDLAELTARIVPTPVH